MRLGPPYPLLRRAERDAREQFPNAHRIHALWTPAAEHEIHVEVWTSGDHASVRAWQPTSIAR